jgi:hypothetical protein
MKIRSGFVSNSSSSSFIVVPRADGKIRAENYGTLNATFGIGMTTSDFRTEQEQDDGIKVEDFFNIVYEEDGNTIAFIRSFSQMLDTQTLSEFKEETKNIFLKLYGARANNVKGPFILAGGELGDGG